MNTEIEVYLKFARNLARDRQDITERVASYEESLSHLKEKLESNKIESINIGKNLKALSIRGGLIDKQTAKELTNFEEILDILEERYAENEQSNLPKNVIDFAKYQLIQIEEANEQIVLISEDEIDEDELVDVEISLTESVKDVLSSLTASEAKMIRLRYGTSDSPTKEFLVGNQVMTYRYIAKSFECSESSVGRKIRTALRKLRHPTRCFYLKNFIPISSIENGEHRLLLEIFGRGI